MENKNIKEQYLGKANHILEYEINDEGDIGEEIAKSIVANYLEQCKEDGVADKGEEFGLTDQTQYKTVQTEIENIVDQLLLILKEQEF